MTSAHPSSTTGYSEDEEGKNGDEYDDEDISDDEYTKKGVTLKGASQYLNYRP